MSVRHTAEESGQSLSPSDSAAAGSGEFQPDPIWAQRRRGFRATLYSREWLLATTLYVLFAILAAATLLP